MAESDRGKVLMLTVGTGDLMRPEESLLTPLKKSMKQGRWERIVLLPSQITKSSADVLRETLAGMPIDIKPLPRAKQEDDADKCYFHFDAVIGGLRAEGFGVNQIVADFTRGTKAMSAALVLAAVRHDLPRIRYITGKRDQRGMVEAGSEVVSEFETRLSTGGKLADLALNFFRRGNFSGVLDVLPDPRNPLIAPFYPEEILDLSAGVRGMAAFYAAWDRLDYSGASRIELPADKPRGEWAAYFPTRDMRSWVGSLQAPLPKNFAQKAGRLRKLAADLLANGERRIRDLQFEDAVLRAFRVVELVGQIRCLDHGYDTEHLNPDDPAVRSVPAGSHGADRSFAGRGPKEERFPRRKAAELLKVLKDPMASKLIRHAESGVLSAEDRNLSILIHGFEPNRFLTKGSLRDHFKKLETLLLEDGGHEASSWIAVARSMDLSGL